MAKSLNNYVIFILIILMSIPYCIAVSCMNGFCFEICLEDDDPTVSCINREIDFSMATAGSRLYCLHDTTCINITLKCPNAPSSVPCTTTPCRHNCEIYGKDTVFQSRQNWTIYAPNSFNDVTITDFNVHVEGTMYCGTGYNHSCSIQYGLWNCKNFSNNCFVSTDNEAYIDCTEDGQCQGETISCPDVEEGANTIICNVICSGTESCANTTINCGTRTQCNVLCTGDRSCFGAETPTTLNCPFASQEDCVVTCGSATTSNSCNNININAVDLRGNLNIIAMSAYSLSNASIYGPDYGGIYVECNGIHSCDNATFVADYSDLIHIGCNYDEGGAACQDIKIHCPETSLCLLNGTASDKHSDLQIFGIEGWDDIIIADEYKVNTVIDIEGKSKMHCGMDYESSCLIQSEWFCDCPPLPTIQPSISPVMSISPTMSPTPGPDDDGMSDRDKNGYIVGGTFVGFVVLCVLAFMIWYCFCRDKNAQQTEDYQAVKNAENGANGDGSDADKKQEDDVEMAQRKDDKDKEQQLIVKEEDDRNIEETKEQDRNAENNDVVPDQDKENQES